MIDRFRAHFMRTDDDNSNWSIEKLESILTDLIPQNIIELVFDKNKIKETQGYTVTEDSQIESITLTVPETFVFQETQKIPFISLIVPCTPKRPV